MREVNGIPELYQLVGQELGTSEWVTVDQARIDRFAEATGDHQWIHVDVERAKKELPDGRTIAHGYLTVSLIPLLTSQIFRINNVSKRLNYGSNKVRFMNSVPSGSRVRAKYLLKAVEPFKNGAVQIINEVTVEIEGQERPACIAETISIAFP